jgi:ABC-type multidrug transport system fused ATPase/permease subunit
VAADRTSGWHRSWPERGCSTSLLTGFNLIVEVGQMVALVRVNGAGKTTAINALLGIVDLDQGRVEIDGLDAAQLSPGRRLGHFGLLTQEFGRYNVTIRDIVRLGTPEPVSDEQIWAALEAAHIGGLVHGLPDGLDTQLGPQFDGIGLLGGQWQRLALARIRLSPTPSSRSSPSCNATRPAGSLSSPPTTPGPSATWITSTSSITVSSSSTAATKT